MTPKNKSVPSVMSDKSVPSVKFTGDNWNLHEYDSCIILRDGKHMVCRFSKNARGRTYANFIKAAPKMFTALMEVLNWYNAFTPQATGRMFVPDDMIENVLKAIQKARGER